MCFALNIVSRLAMAMTSTRWVLLVSLLGPNTVAGAMGVPVMTIGVKRYTNTLNRGFAFSLFYTLMNVAALSQVRWCVGGGNGAPHLSSPLTSTSTYLATLSVSIPCQGVLMDFFRIRWKHGFDVPSLSGKSLLNNGNRLFLASGVGLEWRQGRQVH